MNPEAISRAHLQELYREFETAHRVWLATPRWTVAGRAVEAAKDAARRDYDTACAAHYLAFPSNPKPTTQ